MKIPYNSRRNSGGEGKDVINALLIIGALVAAAGTVPYIRGVLKGTARPQLVSWFVWGVLAAIMAISAYLAGARASPMLSLAGVVSCVAVVTLGWRQGNVRLNRTDIMCLIGAAIGLAVLIVGRNPFMALIVALVVDVVAYIPTVIHGWKRPHEEALACYVYAIIGASITLFAATHVRHPSLAGMLYPLCAVLLNSAMSCILVVGRLSRLPARPAEEALATYDTLE